MWIKKENYSYLFVNNLVGACLDFTHSIAWLKFDQFVKYHEEDEVFPFNKEKTPAVK